MAGPTQPGNQVNDNQTSKPEKGKEIAATDEREKDSVDASAETPKKTKDDGKKPESSSKVKANHPEYQVIGDVDAPVRTRGQIRREMGSVASAQSSGSTLEKATEQESKSPTEKKTEPIETGKSSQHQGGQKTKRRGKKKGKSRKTEATQSVQTPNSGSAYLRYLPLYKAALSGDWDTAHKLIKQSHDDLRTARINSSKKTALHVAVGTGKANRFVKELVELMTADQLLETDTFDNNALQIAALVGNTEAAVLLVDKRPDLLYNCGNDLKNFPFHLAAQNGHKKTLSYLLEKTRHHPFTNQNKPSPFAKESGVQLLRHVIFSGFYDVALVLVHGYLDLAAETQSINGSKYHALGEIAKDVNAFPSGSHMSCLRSFIYKIVPVNFNDDCEKHKRSDAKNPAVQNEHKGGDPEDPHNSSQVTATTPEWNWARWAKEFKFDNCKEHKRSGTETPANESEYKGGDPEDPPNSFQVTATTPLWNWARWAKETFSICVTFVSQKLRLMPSKARELLVAVPCIKVIKHIRDHKLKHKQALQLVKCLCQEVINSKPDESESFATYPLLKAAELGIHEVVQEIVDFFPGLVWATNKQNRNIFNLALTHRHENVFNLLYQMSEHKQFITQIKYDGGNNILHFVAELAPPEKLSLLPGAALQMQRELQWFEAVEKLVNPAYKYMRNKSKTGNRTPSELFTEAHKDLVIQGEKWMKDTANACSIVATLIITVVFAAAITVPGGNKDESGLPIFSNQMMFNIFAVADTISLFTSTTSALLFLSILTSRCAESDFLCDLPKKLIFGLITLFLSITMMMVAFGSAIYLVFCQEKATWILIALGTLTLLPITFFMWLQFPLLKDLISSTCRNSFRKQSDRPFY